MPSVSSAQQRLMGQAYALRMKEIKLSDINPKYRKEIKSIADGDMTDKELKKFATTKSSDLPHHVKDGKPVKEEATPKQIPSNYIGAVAGNVDTTTVQPGLNVDAGKGQDWWENTGKRTKKKKSLKHLKEWAEFSDPESVNEILAGDRDKVNELIDFLKTIMPPFEFSVVYDKILFLIIDTMIGSYGDFFNKLKRSIPEKYLEQIPLELSND
jgi:hypothetical protein